MAFDAEFARHTAPAKAFAVDAGRFPIAAKPAPAHDDADLLLAMLYIDPRPCAALDALIAG